MRDTGHQRHKHMLTRPEGFSLLELILVLTLLGIIGLVGTMGFVHFSRGFIFASETTAITAKGQLAMMRLAKELQSLSAASTATPTGIAFTALRDGVSHDYEVRQLGTTVLFSDIDANLIDRILVDRVRAEGLDLKYYTAYDDAVGQSTWSPAIRLIEINLSLNGPDNIAIDLKTRVAVRNM